jgi:hypothetical protein
MARVPNADKAYIETPKIGGYLLSDSNAKGKPKAGFFKQFGFGTERPEQLANALLTHVASCHVHKVTTSSYGVKYEIIGPMPAPDGRVPFVKAVWMIGVGSENPRLVTAFPY